MGKACDALMGVARRAKYYSGPEPVFGYLFAKEAEVRSLRVILSGKQSSVPPRKSPRGCVSLMSEWLS